VHAGAALAEAEARAGAKFTHYQPYWVEGLAGTAPGLAALVSAGLAVRSVIWLHPVPAPSATSLDEPAAAAPPASAAGGVPALVEALVAARAEAAWGTPLGSLALLEVLVGPGSSSEAAETVAGSLLFHSPGAAAAIASPAWAPADGSGLVAAQQSAPDAASAPCAAPEQTVGVVELSRALLTVCSQAAGYDAWRAAATVVALTPPSASDCSGGGSSKAVTGDASDMPASSDLVATAGPSISCYERLLQGVPPERQGIPLLLAAMVQQVRGACRC